MDGSDLLHLLEDTHFTQKIRGYDPIQVDALIDRASREIADLRAERKSAIDRAELAEKRVERELDAIEKARVTSEAEIATAEAEGRRIVAEAESEAARLRTAAESEVRSAIEVGRQQLLEETSSLETSRDVVRDDISIMERHIDAHRERLLATLLDLRKLIEGLEGRPLAEVARPFTAHSGAQGAGEEVTSDTIDESVAGQKQEQMPARKSPSKASQDLPTLAIGREGLLDELRRPVASDAAAMDAFFTED